MDRVVREMRKRRDRLRRYTINLPLNDMGHQVKPQVASNATRLQMMASLISAGFTVDQIAQQWRVHPATVYRWWSEVRNLADQVKRDCRAFEQEVRNLA